ncbi:MAG: MucB/RseB C-terminal domain-containing protein, partial [Acidimicrobiia bacterium]
MFDDVAWRWIRSHSRSLKPASVCRRFSLANALEAIGRSVRSAQTEQLPGADAPVTHIVYSDGMATVSVFIAEKNETRFVEKSNVGASNTY